MGKINQLDKSIYNRLSAGEVVENPASIVKELVENSIDAGAKHITIMIENGGIKSITVIDDGCGIEEDDLKFSVLPHATSKISCVEDLETIGTLGFRGEALASISSVSKMTIKSRFIDDKIAHFIEVEGGEIVESGECSLALGTTISVHSLFYNTPARFKFLKPPKSEEKNITKLMGELILANSDVGFKYIVDGEQIYFTEGDDIDEGLCTVFGQDVCDNFVYFNISEKNYTIKGYVGRPGTSAIFGNRNKQVFIVNGRVFVDSELPAVIQNAYEEQLMKRTFPAVVLDIVMPFDELDVNVHPGKKEVRFSEKKFVKGLIYSTIKKALAEDKEEREEEFRMGMLLSDDTKDNIGVTLQRIMEIIPNDKPNMVADVSKERIKRLMKKYEIKDTDLGPLKHTMSEYSCVKNDNDKEKNFFDVIDDQYTVPPDIPDEKLLEGLPPEIVAQLKRNPYDCEIEQGEKFDIAYVDEHEAEKEQETLRGVAQNYEPMRISEEETELRSRYRVVGQVFDTYIIIESGRKLYFIDQHAAHERILYDKLMEETKRVGHAQNFIIPYEKKLEPEEIEVFRKYEKNLWELGFDIRFHGNKLEITAAPCALSAINLDEFVYSLLDNSGEINFLHDIVQIRARFARIACRSAIKGGTKLSDEEIDFVMDYFFKNNMPLQCPHGRPTVITLAQTTIEKWFKRIV